MDYNLPGSSVHGIFQTRILVWVVISVSRGSFSTQGSNSYLLHWQADSLPLSHLGSAELMFLQTTRVLWRRKESQGSLHTTGYQSQLRKAKHWSSLHPTMLGYQVSFDAAVPQFGAWKTGDKLCPEPQKCLESKAHDLVTPWLTPLPSLTPSQSPHGEMGTHTPSSVALALLPTQTLVKRNRFLPISSDLAICSQGGMLKSLA